MVKLLVTEIGLTFHIIIFVYSQSWLPWLASHTLKCRVKNSRPPLTIIRRAGYWLVDGQSLNVITTEQGNGLTVTLSPVDIILAPDAEFMQDSRQWLAVIG